MRAILDMRTRKVLRLCGSTVTAMRTFAMLQIERNKHLDLCRRTQAAFPPHRNFKLGICELVTTRHIGDIVPEGEFTIIHQEK